MASIRISDRQCAACSARATHRSYNGHYACDDHGEAEVVELIETAGSGGAHDAGYSSEEIQVTHETEAAVVRRPQHLALVRRRRRRKKTRDAGGAQPGSSQPTAFTDAVEQSSCDRGDGSGGGSGGGSSSKRADEEESPSLLSSFDSFSLVPSAFDTPPSMGLPSESPSRGSSSGGTTSASTTANAATHFSSGGSSSSATVPVMSPPSPRRCRSNSPTSPSTTQPSCSNNTAVRTRRTSSQKPCMRGTGSRGSKETRSQKSGSLKSRGKKPGPSETSVQTPNSTAVRRISLDRRGASEGDVSDGGSCRISRAASREGAPVQGRRKTASGTTAGRLSSGKKNTSGDSRESSVAHPTTSPVTPVVTPNSSSLPSDDSLSDRGRVSSSGKAHNGRKSQTSRRSAVGAGSIAADVPSRRSKSIPPARKGSPLSSPPIRQASLSSAATASPSVRRMFKTIKHSSELAGISKGITSHAAVACPPPRRSSSVDSTRKASPSPIPKNRIPLPPPPRPPSSSKQKPPDGSSHRRASTVGTSNSVTPSSNLCILDKTTNGGGGVDITKGNVQDGGFTSPSSSGLTPALSSDFPASSSNGSLSGNGRVLSGRGSDASVSKAARRSDATSATATPADTCPPHRRSSSADSTRKASPASTPTKRTPSPIPPRPSSSSKQKPPDGSSGRSASMVGNSNSVTQSSNLCIIDVTTDSDSGAGINTDSTSHAGSLDSPGCSCVAPAFSFGCPTLSSNASLSARDRVSSGRGSDSKSKTARRRDAASATAAPAVACPPPRRSGSADSPQEVSPAPTSWKCTPLSPPPRPPSSSERKSPYGSSQRSASTVGNSNSVTLSSNLCIIDMTTDRGSAAGINARRASHSGGIDSPGFSGVAPPSSSDGPASSSNGSLSGSGRAMSGRGSDGSASKAAGRSHAASATAMPAVTCPPPRRISSADSTRKVSPAPTPTKRTPSPLPPRPPSSSTQKPADRSSRRGASTVGTSNSVTQSSNLCSIATTTKSKDEGGDINTAGTGQDGSSTSRSSRALTAAVSSGSSLSPVVSRSGTKSFCRGSDDGASKASRKTVGINSPPSLPAAAATTTQGKNATPRRAVPSSAAVAVVPGVSSPSPSPSPSPSSKKETQSSRPSSSSSSTQASSSTMERSSARSQKSSVDGSSSSVGNSSAVFPKSSRGVDDTIGRGRGSTSRMTGNNGQKGTVAASSSSPVASAMASDSSSPSSKGSLPWRGSVSSSQHHDGDASKDSRRRVVAIAPTAATARLRRSKRAGHARKALTPPAPKKRALSPSRPSSTPSNKSSRRNVSSQDVRTTPKPKSVTPCPNRQIVDTFTERVGDDQGANADDNGGGGSSVVARKAGDTSGGGGGPLGSKGKRARNSGSVSSSSSACDIRSVSAASVAASNGAAKGGPSSTGGGLNSNNSLDNAEAASSLKRSRGRPRKYPSPPADSRFASTASASSLPSVRKLAVTTVTTVSRSGTTEGVSVGDLHNVPDTLYDDVGGAVSPVQPELVEEISRDQPIVGKMRRNGIGRRESVDQNSASCDDGSLSPLQPQQQLLKGKAAPSSVTATGTAQGKDVRGRFDQRRGTDTSVVKIQILDVSDFLEDMPSKTTTTQITTTEVPSGSPMTSSSTSASSPSPAPTTTATATKQVASVVQTRQGRGTTVEERGGALMMGHAAGVTGNNSGSSTLTGGDPTQSAGATSANVTSTTIGRRKNQRRLSGGGAAAAPASAGERKAKRLKVIGGDEIRSPSMNTRSSGGDVGAAVRLAGEVCSDEFGAEMDGGGRCLMVAAAHVRDGSSNGKGKSRMTTRAQEAVCTYCHASIILKRTGHTKNGFNWCNQCLKGKATCVGCFEEDLRYRMARCYEDHAWCETCLSRHLKLKVDSGETVYYDTIPCTPECGYLRGLSVPLLIGNLLSRRIEQRQVNVALLVAGERDKPSQKLISKSTKACPGCSVPIEKRSGCDHIKCPYCHHQFWFKCNCPYNPKRPGHSQQCNQGF